VIDIFLRTYLINNGIGFTQRSTVHQNRDRQFEWSPFQLTQIDFYGGMRNLQTLIPTEINQHQCLEVSHSAVSLKTKSVQNGSIRNDGRSETEVWAMKLQAVHFKLDKLSLQFHRDNQ
jgi:hypothetical protein